MKFITTTLPYVNSIPHIGHAFEFILGDALSKYFKSNNEEVHFNIGLDEHGLKVWQKALELEIDVNSHINNLTDKWIDFCNLFNIEYDSFYKTSDKSHHEKVKVIWNNFIKKGDIYKSSYKGKYCIGCESSKNDSELINNKCPDHQTSELIYVDEENYFFKLSKYKDNLLKWINESPEFLQPKSKLEELKNLILNTEDISVSRLKSNCPWGIEVPNDEEQIIYVWFDALLNYIFAAGYLTDYFNWNNVIQICGPDNLRFQAVIFQSFLEAEGIKKSNTLLVHGTILDENGHKMSKSVGNTIDPIEELNKFGLYPIRYYALAGLNTYTNSSWNENDLKTLWNSDIVNDWGNLVSRVLHLIDIKDSKTTLVSNEFNEIVDTFKKDISSLWSNFKVKEALHKTNELVKLGNKYITENTPWSSENYEEILSNLYYLINTVNDLYLPIFGSKTKEVKILLNKKKKVILYEKLT